MKKLILSIACIIYSISCIAQKIALSNTINITPPQGIEKLSNDQFSTSGSSKFKHSAMAVDNIIRSAKLNNNTDFYKLDGMFISLVHGDEKVESNHLIDIKNGFDEMNHKIKDSNHYNSEIKAVNDSHVLIMYNDWQNVGYYNFHCWNKDYSQSITGTIQFELKDKERAAKVLDDLLKGAEFKK